MTPKDMLIFGNILSKLPKNNIIRLLLLLLDIKVIKRSWILSVLFRIKIPAVPVFIGIFTAANREVQLWHISERILSIIWSGTGEKVVSWQE